MPPPPPRNPAPRQPTTTPVTKPASTEKRDPSAPSPLAMPQPPSMPQSPSMPPPSPGPSLCLETPATRPAYPVVMPVGPTRAWSSPSANNKVNYTQRGMEVGNTSSKATPQPPTTATFVQETHLVQPGIIPASGAIKKIREFRCNLCGKAFTTKYRC
eukprot:CAMPEP_0170198966 /NCGR_PEP_ID=MMETSP0040_2-20121228/69078_1 /TAXON_ID=641309 /ORGANISM="Lotharella oceanica, Strain CCMP622" /LENGTH=156 /DNA_ID=CAMNT_0010449037 /DNA_START=23 /DNA_END=493 /DNA_ORIENTATION=-